MDEEVINTHGGFVGNISFLALLAGGYLWFTIWGITHEAIHLREHHTDRKLRDKKVDLDIDARKLVCDVINHRHVQSNEIIRATYCA